MELNSIIGTGITPFNRSDRSIEEMAFVAVRDALCDAGVTKDQIDVVVASNAVAIRGNENKGRRKKKGQKATYLVKKCDK